MALRLKPINDQVLFITGATSEIGLETVRLAVERGARVFMVGKDEDKLQQIQDEMRHQDRPTAYAIADVGEMDQLQMAADFCIQTFGRIDTWINNPLMLGEDQEIKGLFERNFWGVVNGSKIAASMLKDHSGAIVNIGSFLPEEHAPAQGMLEASKMMMKGYTTALQKEMKEDKIPVTVSLVVPVVGQSSTVAKKCAEIILKCAQKPIKEIKVGSPSWLEHMRKKTFLTKATLSPKSWLTSGVVASGAALVFFKRKKLI